VTVVATQALIDVLAERIERAFRLRRPQWNGSCSTSRVWSVAATILWEAHEADPALPPDPELFVAAQPANSPYSNPWQELACDESVRWYRERVCAIIEVLRSELSAEVMLAEERISAYRSVSKVLLATSRRISPLARFIVAQRAGHHALAGRFRTDAAEQHRSCPLYRQASRELLPPGGVYPIPEPRGAVPAPPVPRRSRTQAHLN
jgi:hypothetical protein